MCIVAFFGWDSDLEALSHSSSDSALAPWLGRSIRHICQMPEPAVTLLPNKITVATANLHLTENIYFESKRIIAQDRCR